MSCWGWQLGLSGMRDRFGIFGAVIRIRKLSLLWVMTLRMPNGEKMKNERHAFKQINGDICKFILEKCVLEGKPFFDNEGELAVRPEFEKLRRWNTMLRPTDYTHAVELWCVADSWVSYVYMWMMRTTKWIYILCRVLCIELLGIYVCLYIYIYLLFLK